MTVESVFYEGPSRDYKQQDGANDIKKREDTSNASTATGFADIDYLLKLLTLVKTETRAQLNSMERELNQLVLKVNDSEADVKLKEALVEEWPSTKVISQYVPYVFYKALELRSTASAAYIRQRWEASARDVNGITYFDLVKVLQIIDKEVDLIVDFVARFIGEVDDSSEERVAEQLQEWAAFALTGVRVIRTLDSAKNEPQGIAQSELDLIGAKEAAEHQAIFKVKINAINAELDQHLSSLTKTYSNYSEAFYNRMLGPALQFRLNASRKLYPGSSQLAYNATAAAEASNANFSSLLADLTRRNQIFVSKLDSVNDSISLRNRYIKYIKQLGTKSGAVSPGTITTSTTEINPDEWFDAVDTSATVTPYRPSHDKLVDREVVDAHPQYLDRFGRNMLMQDIPVATGVKVDGVDLSQHAHTGEDGSQKIEGKHIAGLVAEAIDHNVVVERPFNLQLFRTIPGSDGTYNAVISWEGPAHHTYDVHLTSLEDAIDTGYARVHTGVGLESYFILSIHTYDGTVFYAVTLSIAGAEFVKIEGAEVTPLFSEYDVLDFTGMDPGNPDNVTNVITGLNTAKISVDGEVYFISDENRLVKYSESSGFSTVCEGVPLENTKIEGFTLSENREDIYVFFSTDGSHSLQTGSLGGALVEVSDNIDVGLSVPIVTHFVGFTNSKVYYMGINLSDEYGITGADTLSYTFNSEVMNTEVRDDFVSGLPTSHYASNVAFVKNEALFLVVHYDPFLVDGVQSSSLYSLKIEDPQQFVDISSSIYIPKPVGLCKDRYGRVYTANSETKEIYRIFGPNGSGTF